MRIKQFVQQNRDDWKKLEHLLAELHHNKRQISGQKINQFNRLYQKTAQHLSYCQTYFPEEDVTAYLNELVAKSHNLLYKNQVSSLKQIKTFFTTTFIKLLLEQWKAVLFAMLLFAGGALAAFLSVLNNPVNLYMILPEDVAQSIDPSQIGADSGAVNSSTMSAMIMTNNIQVAFLAFAGGITFGILTVYLLISNGIMIGALAAVYAQSGQSYEFWAYIVPHGIIELTAIFIAGGAGLLMGYKFFVPGPYKRVHQFTYQAKRSVQLLIGTIPLFVIAGIIEGYITPSTLSLEVKYTVALLTLLSLILYTIIGKLMYKEETKATLGS